jgi:hypothetical protein
MSGPPLPEAHIASPSSPPNPSWTPGDEELSPQVWNAMSPPFPPFPLQQGGNCMVPQQFARVLPHGEAFISPFLLPQPRFPTSNLQLANASNVQKSGPSSQAGMEVMHNSMHCNQNFPIASFAETDLTQPPVQYPMQFPLTMDFPFISTIKNQNPSQIQQLSQGQFSNHKERFNYGQNPTYSNPGGWNQGHIQSPSRGQNFNHIQSLNPRQDLNYYQQLYQTPLSNVQQFQHNNMVGQHTVPNHVPHSHMINHLVNPHSYISQMPGETFNQNLQHDSVHNLSNERRLCNNARPHMHQPQHANKPFVELARNCQPPSQLHSISSLQESSQPNVGKDGKALLLSGPQPFEKKQVGGNEQTYKSQQEELQLYDESNLFNEDTRIRVELPHQGGVQLSQSILSDGNEMFVEEQKLPSNIETFDTLLKNDDLQVSFEDFTDISNNDSLSSDLLSGDFFSSDHSSTKFFSSDFFSAELSSDSDFPGFPNSEDFDFGLGIRVLPDVQNAKAMNVNCANPSGEFAESSPIETSKWGEDLLKEMDFEYQKAKGPSNELNGFSEPSINGLLDQGDEKTIQEKRGAGQVVHTPGLNPPVLSEPGPGCPEIRPSMDQTGLAGAIGLTLEEFEAKVYRLRQVEVAPLGLEQNGINSGSQTVNEIAESPTNPGPGNNENFMNGLENCNSGDGVGKSMIGILKTSTNPHEGLESDGVSSRPEKATNKNQTKGFMKAGKIAPARVSKASRDVAEHQAPFSQENFALMASRYGSLTQNPVQVSSQVAYQGLPQGLILDYSQTPIQGFSQNRIQDYSQSALQGYQAPARGYYQTPIQGYQTPSGGYSRTPIQGYQTPSGGYSRTPTQGYQTPSGGYSRTQIQGFPQPPIEGFTQALFARGGPAPVQYSQSSYGRNMDRVPMAGHLQGQTAYGGQSQMPSNGRPLVRSERKPKIPSEDKSQTSPRKKTQTVSKRKNKVCRPCQVLHPMANSITADLS